MLTPREVQYSCVDESGPAEWVTEGIQIGEATSGMGVLGMWTGAQHERMDPLGAFHAIVPYRPSSDVTLQVHSGRGRSADDDPRIYTYLCTI